MECPKTGCAITCDNCPKPSKFHGYADCDKHDQSCHFSQAVGLATLCRCPMALAEPYIAMPRRPIIAMNVLGSVREFILSGELTYENVDLINEVIESIGVCPVVIGARFDIGRVSYVDSSGLGSLARGWKRLRLVHKTLEVVNAQGQVDGLMHLTHIHMLFSPGVKGESNRSESFAV